MQPHTDDQVQKQEVQQQQTSLQTVFWPWDKVDPFDYPFNMDDAVLELQKSPYGNLFDEFELADSIVDQLANYELAIAQKIHFFI